jgi:hypothetical protein
MNGDQPPLTELSEIGLADVAEHPYAQLTVDEADVITRHYWGALHPRTFVETSSIEAVRTSQTVFALRRPVLSSWQPRTFRSCARL